MADSRPPPARSGTTPSALQLLALVVAAALAANGCEATASCEEAPLERPKRLKQPYAADIATGRFPLPEVVLWAWRRPEDLRFLDPSTTGVAFLAGTVSLSSRGGRWQGRSQPLRLPRATKALPVVRLEATSDADLSQKVARDVAEQIVESLGLAAEGGSESRWPGVQIDFDATLSQRGFYEALLRHLRQRLHASQVISIAALASWCLDDAWISHLPIDEAVPMLYRMGPEATTIRARLRRGGDFSTELCRTSIGISSDENVPTLPSSRRRYLFHPVPWTATALDQLLLETKVTR